MNTCTTVYKWRFVVMALGVLVFVLAMYAHTLELAGFAVLITSFLLCEICCQLGFSDDNFPTRSIYVRGLGMSFDGDNARMLSAIMIAVESVALIITLCYIIN